MTAPQTLKTALEQGGLGQSLFARLTGYDVGTVSRWVRGVQPTPDVAFSWLRIWGELSPTAKQIILSEAETRRLESA